MFVDGYVRITRVVPTSAMDKLKLCALHKQLKSDMLPFQVAVSPQEYLCFALFSIASVVALSFMSLNMLCMAEQCGVIWGDVWGRWP
jgi:hypothetical protein